MCCGRHKVQLDVTEFNWALIELVQCCVVCSAHQHVSFASEYLSHILFVLWRHMVILIRFDFLDYYVLPISSQHQGTQAAL